jgi:hypothetical protein
MQIKSFLYDLKERLSSTEGAMDMERELTFKLRIGYRHESNEKESR